MKMENSGIKKNNSRFMEGVWLFVAFLSLTGSIHAFTHRMGRQGVIFLIMVIMSLAMYALRRYFRMKNKNKDS